MAGMKWLWILLVLSAILPAAAQERSLATQTTDCSDSNRAQSGIVYGESHAFGLTAPCGWVLDNNAGVSRGLHAVFYPLGSDWKTAKTVMYASVARKMPGQERLEDLIAYDMEQAKKNQPTLAVEEGDSIQISNGVSGRVVSFTGGKPFRSERVAYIDAPKVFVMLIVTGKEKLSADEEAAFRSLAKSYSFLADKVIAK
jgi:hypothetical protein